MLIHTPQAPGMVQGASDPPAPLGPPAPPRPPAPVRDDRKRESGFLNRPASTRSFLTAIAVGSVATIAALVIGTKPLFESARARSRADSASALLRAKEPSRSSGILVHIAPPLPLEGPQRVAAGGPEVRPELVATGERLRIAIQPGPRSYYFVVSVDERGRVVPLYPEFGTSLELPTTSNLQYLPDAIELTGRGRERLVVLLTDLPLELDEIQRATTAALAQVGGDIGHMRNLALPGDQFHRLFQKP